MSDEPLPKELLDLLSVDPPPTGDVQSRIEARLATSFAASAGAPALAHEVLSELASEAASTAAAATTAAGVVSTKVALLLAFGGLGVGAAGGAAAYHVLAVPPAIEAPPEVVEAPPETHPSVDQEALPVLPVLPLVPEVPEVRMEEAPIQAPEEPPSMSESRRRERVLLRQAQSALVRSQPDDALSALARHRRRFPTSALAEERDALEVDALFAAGRAEDAAAAARRFITAYPGSVFASRVRRALSQ